MYRAKKYFLHKNKLIYPGDEIESLDEKTWARLRENEAIETLPDEVEAKIDDGRGIDEMYENLKESDAAAESVRTARAKMPRGKSGKGSK